MATPEIGTTQEEREKIATCKAVLRRQLEKTLRRYGPPVTVAAYAETTAELSFVIAGKDLTIALFAEFARQLALRPEEGPLQ